MAESNEKEIDHVIPMIGIRRIIATRLEESLKNYPQASTGLKVDMSQLIKIKEQCGRMGTKVTYTEMIIKITAMALEENPGINASRQEKVVEVYKSKNIGLAISTKSDTLIIPVIRNVENKSLLQVSAEVKQLIEKANTGRLSSVDVTGGTFTVSSIGMYGVEWATPILNIPEAAILAVGAIKREVIVEENDEMVIKPVATLSLTFDHATVDGVPAAKFMASLKRMVENASECLKIE